MIVRATKELCAAVRGPCPSSPEDVVRLDSLAKLIPQWMSEALMTGTVLVMGPEDFHVLDQEVRQRLEILKR